MLVAAGQLIRPECMGGGLERDGRGRGGWLEGSGERRGDKG